MIIREQKRDSRRERSRERNIKGMNEQHRRDNHEDVRVGDRKEGSLVRWSQNEKKAFLRHATDALKGTERPGLEKEERRKNSIAVKSSKDYLEHMD